MEIPPNIMFKLGRVVMTPGAITALAASNESPWSFLARHLAGDWGDLDAEDKGLNDLAVKGGSRIFSAYITANGARIWVITEADRSLTAILLPDEY